MDDWLNDIEINLAATAQRKNFIVSPSTKKYLKTKRKSYRDEATDFHDKEIPKLGSNFICLAVVLTGFVLKKEENCYPQVLLKECKYIEKEKKDD